MLHFDLVLEMPISGSESPGQGPATDIKIWWLIGQIALGHTNR